MPELKITKSFGVIRAASDAASSPLLKSMGISEIADNELWGIATSSVLDSMGDIIRCEGVDFATYHQPPTTYMKMLAGHARLLPDGSPPVVGRVEEFRSVMVPDPGSDQLAAGLAFRMSFATGEDGQLTPLAATYRNLYKSEAPCMDSFSVGLLVSQYAFTDLGLDVQKSVLYEISCVASPALPSANVIKMLRDAMGDTLDPASLRPQPPRPTMGKSLEAIGQTLQYLQKQADAWAARPDLPSALSERLDAIESLLVVQRDAITTASTTRNQVDARDIDRLAKSLAELKSFVGR